jgi:hypothetical protein
MATGLRIWGPDGRLVVDVTHRLGKPVAVVGIPAQFNGSGSYTDGTLQNLVNQGQRLFAAFQREHTFGWKTNSWNVCPPRITISGATVSWQFGGKQDGQAEVTGGLLVIGVF